MWVAVARRQNPHGSQGIPKSYDYICSNHFIGGKKSEEELSPSYIPTIFPPIYKYRKVNELSVENRYKRLKDRRMKNKLSSTSYTEPPINEFVEIMIENPPVSPQKVDQGCQVDFYSNFDVNSQTFICNRYIKNEISHAETQTEITEVTGATKVNYTNKKYVTTKCGTVQKTFVDQESQADDSRFAGFSSITKNHELIDVW
ncbi:PREDICTED: uncharacterized protein LOC107074038 [Polistes dominula]|uniref:Uncharacterized protein LOC107074038 n=1 Tax=Polistes dominula TaxID=743375 RepID=A0ABM1JDK3_POLDO|nr:PREDICTED: uncharacterized protein LOC107074038 [Polistes dominula]